jgi:ATP-dependent Zn protease
MTTYTIHNSNKTLYSYISKYLVEKLHIGDTRELVSNSYYDVLKYNLFLSPYQKEKIQFDYDGINLVIEIKKDSENDKFERSITLLITINSIEPQKIMNKLIEDAKNYHNRTVQDYINVNICNYQGKWEKTTKVQKRTKETIYLPDKTINFMFDDINKFYARKEKYNELCIPHKRTYLFFGPPGTGKTSFIKMMASHFNKTIGIINLSYYFSNESLINAISNFDADFLVIEDFEQIIRDSNASPSAIINTIDGIVNRDGLVMFLTTNNIEKLGDVVTRPGRIDKILEIGHATKEVITKMVTKFFPEQTDKIDKFCEDLPKKITTAKLENYFMHHLEDKDICKHVKELFKNELEEGTRKTLENKYSSYGSVYA